MRSQDKRYFKDDVGSVVKENDPITINMGYPPVMRMMRATRLSSKMSRLLRAGCGACQSND